MHLPLCLPLMRGWGSVPALGLPGFALALAISRAFGVTVHLLLWRWRLHLRPRTADWWRLRSERLRAVPHIGLPGAAESVGYRLSILASLTGGSAHRFCARLSRPTIERRRPRPCP